MKTPLIGNFVVVVVVDETPCRGGRVVGLSAVVRSNVCGGVVAEREGVIGGDTVRNSRVLVCRRNRSARKA